MAIPDPEIARPASPPRHEVATDWDVRITVRDGVELSANIWRPLPGPGDPVDARFPAILEMIPYGKDNWRRNADVGRGEYFARRGYALCRLDVRGTGSSGGVALDEYHEEETRDGYDAVEWLAAREWCDGNVGMWGISYGGFTSIQVAKLRPPHLRAIVPVMATDDRYTTDVHYVGGCVTASELSQYAVSQVAMNAMPPDVEFRGGGWIAEWRARLEATPPWLFEWLRRQRDGPYWRPGSLAPDYEAINVADPEHRRLDGLVCRCGVADAGAVHRALPDDRRQLGPRAAGGGNTRSEPRRAPRDGPLLRSLAAWRRGSRGSAARSAPDLVRAGLRTARAVPGSLARSLALGRGIPPPVGRAAGVAPRRPDRCPSRGGWRTNLRPIGSSIATGTGRRRAPAARCRGAPAARPTAWPVTCARTRRSDRSSPRRRSTSRCRSSASRRSCSTWRCRLPIATAVVRLADVAPDGTSAQVTAGILNLTHRYSHANPEPLEPGHVEEIRVQLRGMGYRFEPGHRIRVSIASSAWPVVWPSPFPAEFELHGGAATPSRLILPVVPPAGGPGDLPPPAFKVTPPDAPDVSLGGSSDPPRWEILEDVVDGSVTVTIHDGGSDALHDGRRLYAAETIWLTARDDDPARALLDADVVYRWWEHDHTIEIRARSTQASTATDFDLSVDLEVDLDGASFFKRRWEEQIPRDLV